MSSIIRVVSTISLAYVAALGTTDGHVRPTPDPNPVLLGGDPFDREQYSDGLAAGGVDGLALSDKPFSPEIYYDGAYHPICGIGFNDEAATTACRDVKRFTEAVPTQDDQMFWDKERFNYGGRVVKTNVMLDRDAIPVGVCLKGESLDGCTAGGNAFGDFSALDGRCQKGNEAGVQIVCHRQCRKFGQRLFPPDAREQAVLFGVGNVDNIEGMDELEACKPFLKNTTTYYLEDETSRIDLEGQFTESKISQFASLLDVMGQQCSLNVVELICRSVFKECKEVEVEDPTTGGKANVLLPSLLCKSECERHKATWDECYANIQQESADKELFQSNMQAMSNLMSDYHKEITGKELPKGTDGSRSPFSLLNCDAKGGRAANEIPDEEVAASWILGRHRQTHFDRGDQGFGFGIVGWAFPRFMTSEMLYPEEFSTYTGPDGVSYEVPCTVPGQAAVSEKNSCSPPFTKAISPETNRACVYDCPMGHFTEEEYTIMWAIFVGIGLCSFVLNVFMVTTWKLAGWHEFQATPFQLKSCVFLGLLYGVVETLPTLILKFDLPCQHPTEEEIGISGWCYVNRSGQYMLLGIMVNLCTLTIMIFRALVNSTHHENNAFVNVLSTAVPFLFLVSAYALDTDEVSTENYHLNVARHGFNCSMRFSSMLEEWLVLWLPFCVSCLLAASFSVASWWKIGDIQRALGMTNRLASGAPRTQSEGQKNLAGQRRRLIRIAAMVSVCLLLSVALIGQATVEQAAWTDHEEKKLDCLIKTSGTRNFKDYGFNEKDAVGNVCSLPGDDRCILQVTWVVREFPLEDGSSFTPTCGWYPSRLTTSLLCNFYELIDQYPEDVGDEVRAWIESQKHKDISFHRCECSCSDLLDEIVERLTTHTDTNKNT